MGVTHERRRADGSRRAFERAGVHSHPDPELGIRPDMLAQPELGISRCRERLPRGCRGGEEGVALGALDQAALRSELVHAGQPTQTRLLSQ